jgi:hypothetical protein
MASLLDELAKQGRGSVSPIFRFRQGVLVDVAAVLAGMEASIDPSVVLDVVVAASNSHWQEVHQQ